MNAGGCSPKPARRRSMGKWSLFFLNPKATGEFSSTFGRLGSLFARGRGLEKVPQTNAYPSSIWSAYRGWRTHPHSDRTTMQKGKHKRIILGAWNVWTLLNRTITSRPERGTALVARELQRYRVDIAALSETRIADEGPLREEGGWLHLLERKAASRRPDLRCWVCHQNTLVEEHACATSWNQRAPHETVHPSQQDQIPHNYQRLRPYTYKPRWCQGTILWTVWPSHQVNPIERQTSHSWRL